VGFSERRQKGGEVEGLHVDNRNNR
jgi:hypothetical protein